MLRRTLTLSAALALPLHAVASGGSANGWRARCFGAAAVAHRAACRGVVPRDEVVPTPRRALTLPNAPCAPVGRHRFPYACTFGARGGGARREIALLGDSHASVWRAALGPVAQRAGWHGWSLTRAACPYAFSAPILPARLYGDCIRWRNAIPAWFRAHPKVHTVVVSAHRVRVLIPPGRNRLATEVAGYVSAWAALPRTVRRIVVIRDTPSEHGDTPGCVAAAIRQRADARAACAIPRSAALGTDPEVAAARRAGRRLARVVDMTRFMCDRSLCFPVVGGALVFKDVGHITATFGASMTPYLGPLMKQALR